MALRLERESKDWIHVKGVQQIEPWGLTRAFLIGSWTMLAVWISISIFLLPSNWQWALIIMLCVLVIACYLLRVQSRLGLSQRKIFKLTMDSEFISFSFEDFSTGKSSYKLMPWNDLKWVTIYKHADEPVMILHGENQNVIEIPLWTFSEQKQFVMQVLLHEQIPIVCMS